jgi:hypothetical protein
MKIQATFIGRGHSQYEFGHRYEVYISEVKRIAIYYDKGQGGIIYASLAAFLRNWSDIVVIEQ